MDGNPENWCREGFFTRESEAFSIGTVKGGRTSKAYFYGDEKDECPGSSACRKKAFVVGGDELLINRTYDGYSCAWFTPRSGRPTIGWIKNSDLAVMPKISDVTLTSWLGEWKFDDNSIEFSGNKLAGYLNVTGNASWVGANPGNVHVGELDGRYKPQNGWIEYSDGDDEYDCKVTMRLLGKYLVVADNLKCGGVNVTFSGVYTKKRR